LCVSELESDSVLPMPPLLRTGLEDPETDSRQRRIDAAVESCEFPCARTTSPILIWTERCAVAAALAVLSLPLACVLITVRILSGRPPLVAHRRVGWNGRALWVLKIRTMWDLDRRTHSSRNWIEYLRNTEVPVVKRDPDPRVTSSFAAFCRRFSIDELPQLIHVVSGRMRLAGPRPLTRRELDVYYRDASAEMLSVLPGITGLWQVMGRNDLTYPQRRRLDLFFVRRQTLRLYWLVLLRTPGCLLRGRGV
jgi:exopolysaccharide production protein ExoY